MSSDPRPKALKPLTEQDLRLAWPGAVPAVLALPPGTPITPAARDYLGRHRVTLIFDPAAPPALPPPVSGQPAPEPGPPPAPAGPKPFVGPDGGLFESKPEDLTHLRGRRLVRKDHPVIVWRGRLDAFCARLVEVQVLGLREGRPDLAEELQEILDFCRRLLIAELKDLEVEDFRLLGLTPRDLRERSHHPDRFFGQPHVLMSYKMGPLPVALNALRAEVRAVETAAAAAFGAPGRPPRDDLILALNRLSSLFYIMVYRYLPKDFRPEGAGI
jgi:ethanolamine utilization cobalamin adenosyltransferase